MKRSRAREVGLQLLYQRDLVKDVPRERLEQFAGDRLADEAMRTYALALLDGYLGHAEEIDKRLRAAADNWSLERMAVVDRNVLRLGAFELLFGSEPPAVVLDEWIELARRFGGAGSPGFVNGVLDRVRKSATPPSPPSPSS